METARDHHAAGRRGCGVAGRGAGAAASGPGGGLCHQSNVIVEHHWLGGQNDRLPSLMADLVRRRVAVIATAGDPASLAAKAATATIPIAFGVSGDPVAHGLVASLARPGGNATGINFLTSEVLAKRLGLLRELVPKAVRVVVLVNPSNALSAASVLRDVPEAARAIGLQIDILNASTSGEIEAAFATMARDRIDALFVAPDGYFNARRIQFTTLATHYRIPAAYSAREQAEAGGLMSYGADGLDMYRQVGLYTGRILKGVNPADLPVVQSTKFAFVINLLTARLLGLIVPDTLLARADEVIE
jgi:putative tryptophan/tyrosine transport system substrate-binding protein